MLSDEMHICKIAGSPKKREEAHRSIQKLAKVHSANIVCDFEASTEEQKIEKAKRLTNDQNYS